MAWFVSIAGEERNGDRGLSMPGLISISPGPTADRVVARDLELATGYPIGGTLCFVCSVSVIGDGEPL